MRLPIIVKFCFTYAERLRLIIIVNFYVRYAKAKVGQKGVAVVVTKLVESDEAGRKW